MELLRCGFVEKKPAGIDALAFSHNDKFLAVGRAEGVVEIFDTATWHLLKRIPGEGPHKSVRSLCWIDDDKLFSAGIHGEITEWDLDHLCPKSVEQVGGGALWALCFVEDVGSEGSNFFVACDDGVLRWFVYDERLVLRKSARASKERLLSVVHAGKFMFTGDSMGLIMRWSLPDLSCDAKMSLPPKGDRPSLVWALSSVHDGDVVISGDSFGNVTFWDAIMCTRLQTLCEHQADVLCLATVGSGEDEFVLSSGVDAKISMFSTRSGNWAFHNAAFGRTHDVRALAVDSSGKIASGGVDATLSVQTMFGKPIRIPPFTVPMQVSLSSTSIALIQRDRHAEIWYLPPDEHAAKRQKVDPDKAMKLSVPEIPKTQKLINVSLQTSGHLLASAMSPDGAYFALSNSSGTSIFSLTIEELDCRKINAEYSDPSTQLLFTCPRKLVAASSKTFEVVVVDSATCAVQARFTDHAAAISHLASSREWLCSADFMGQIHLYHMDTLEHYCKVPSFEQGIPTCIAFTKDQPQIVAVSSYHQFFIFDIDSRALKSKACIPAHVLRPHHRICGAITHAHEPEKILFWSSIELIKVNLNCDLSLDEKENLSHGEEANARGLKNTFFSNEVKPWQTERRFRWILSVQEIPWAKRSLLMFEVNPERLQALLPTQFVRKTYGS